VNIANNWLEVKIGDEIYTVIGHREFGGILTLRIAGNGTPWWPLHLIDEIYFW
jgi:hypothetical protein